MKNKRYKTTKERPSTAVLLFRVNTRIRKDQHNYIKALARRLNTYEGEIHREIIDYYMRTHGVK